jgi:hypothetical protein
MNLLCTVNIFRINTKPFPTGPEQLLGENRLEISNEDRHNIPDKSWGTNYLKCYKIRGLIKGEHLCVLRCSPFLSMHISIGNASCGLLESNV